MWWIEDLNKLREEQKPKQVQPTLRLPLPELDQRDLLLDTPVPDDTRKGYVEIDM